MRGSSVLQKHTYRYLVGVHSHTGRTKSSAHLQCVSRGSELVHRSLGREKMGSYPNCGDCPRASESNLVAWVRQWRFCFLKSYLGNGSVEDIYPGNELHVELIWVFRFPSRLLFVLLCGPELLFPLVYRGT